MQSYSILTKRARLKCAVCLAVWFHVVVFAQVTNGDTDKTATPTQKPNLLLIVADDMGFSDTSPYGGEIFTPNIAKLAYEGAMFTNFHVAPTCTPTRAMLLTGRDNHDVGVGNMKELLADNQYGKPGYEEEILLAEAFHGRFPDLVQVACFDRAFHHDMPKVASLNWYLANTEQMSAKEFHHMVNHESGLLGVSEFSSDMRDLLAREAADVRAAEAVALFCYQARKWVCALAGALEGLDTLVLAGGIGENAPEVRTRICRGISPNWR
jgi:hypothetical protein